MALVHAGLPLEPHDLLGAWEMEPGVLLLMGLVGLVYARGLGRLWRDRAASGIRRWEARAFLGGWLVLAVALLSPLHALGATLFSAHMAQHVLLVSVAAPLLVLGRPLVPALWAIPISWRRALGRFAASTAPRRAWRLVSAPLAAWTLHAIALWVWHLPALYQATLVSDLAHTAQHLSFLGTGALFWWSILRGRRARAEYGTAIFFLFATAMHGGALGALIAFASRPWYPLYGDAGMAWGLTALEDQQLAGLVMWIPAGLGYAAAALILLVLWMRESERRTARWQGHARLGSA
jgi:putative membrane protein